LLATLNGITVCTFSVGQEAVVVYQRAAAKYVLSGPGCSSESAGFYVLAASDNISPLEITDYSRPVSWLPGANDNKFRAKLELRYSPATQTVWVINELPIEYYLRGIAETSNVSPLEYQKALLTAARTYAMYHVNRGTKHADEYYHVDAHLDQVYRGFGQEDRSPNIVSGVTNTRGQVVTYDGKLAITPYFSRSDGRTRDWTEVWGGSGYPWLKAVDVPWDAGQTLWGHGVGLSARGALYMASKDNATYDQILKHFYTGIELRQIYK
jgi:peptidoglycan hydrolase-like amidase